MSGKRHTLQARILKIPLGGSNRINQCEVFHVPGGLFVLACRDTDGTQLRSDPEGPSAIAQLMLDLARDADAAPIEERLPLPDVTILPRSSTRAAFSDRYLPARRAYDDRADNAYRGR